MSLSRPKNDLIIFISYSTRDEQLAKKLYKRLKRDGFSPWRDKEAILPGQDWQLEIRRAISNSDVVLICLSPETVNRTGYLQKEIKYAIEVAGMQPEGAIFIIPIKLQRCELPESLKSRQCVDLFNRGGYSRLKLALETRAQFLNPKKSSGRGRRPKYLLFEHALDPLEGEYSVLGLNEDGTEYNGSATIKKQGRFFFIVSHIDRDIYICKGTRSGNSLSVDGDFRVDYTICDNGSLAGMWGKKCTEKLTPLGRDRD